VPITETYQREEAKLTGRCRTWYLLRNSFDSDDDIILRRTEEGAEKWCLRDLRREEETSMEVENQHPHPRYQDHI
jgi:hypothetical protein